MSESIARDIGRMEADMVTMKEDVKSVKKDIQEVKTDIQEIKNTINTAATTYRTTWKIILGVGVAIGAISSFGLKILMYVFR